MPHASAGLAAHATERIFFTLFENTIQTTAFASAQVNMQQGVGGLSAPAGAYSQAPTSFPMPAEQQVRPSLFCGERSLHHYLVNDIALLLHKRCWPQSSSRLSGRHVRCALLFACSIMANSLLWSLEAPAPAYMAAACQLHSFRSASVLWCHWGSQPALLRQMLHLLLTIGSAVLRLSIDSRLQNKPVLVLQGGASQANGSICLAQSSMLAVKYPSGQQHVSGH